jgi:3-deoxy-D-manno-octulosonic-acid transferase
MFFSSLSGRGGGFWLDRLGCPAAGGGKPYWLHAASVGETGSAAAIIRAWKDSEPEARFVLSVGTPAGRAHAESSLADLDCVQFMAPPMDVWGAPGRCLDRVDPRALVIIETEIWPGLIRAASKRRVPVLLAAGRISARTARRYGWVKSFFRQLLNSMDRLLVISEADRSRFLALGVDPDRIEVAGSPKFDPLIAMARGPAPPPIVPGPPYLLVAGSTHPGEEEIITAELLKTLLGRALHNAKKPMPPQTYLLEPGPDAVEAWEVLGSEADAVKAELGQHADLTAMEANGYTSAAPAAEPGGGGAAPCGSSPPGPGEAGSDAEPGAGAGAGDGSDAEAGAGAGDGAGAEAGDEGRPGRPDAKAGRPAHPAAEGGGASPPPPRPSAPSMLDGPLPESRETGTGGLLPGNPFKLILAPRHANRAKEICELASRKGFESRIITDPEIPFKDLPEIGVFAAVGHLIRLYERCDLAIVGGSFAGGLQGHNPMEPAAVARPMIFGPNMTSFHEQARALTERAACIMVVPNTIHTVLSEYAKDPHIAKISGQRGRAYVAGLAPAAPRLAAALRKALGAAAEPAGHGGAGGAEAGQHVPAAPRGEAAGEGR